MSFSYLFFFGVFLITNVFGFTSLDSDSKQQNLEQHKQLHQKQHQQQINKEAFDLPLHDGFVHNCIHDKVQAETPTYDVKIDYNADHEQRKRQTNQFSKIRIVLDNIFERTDEFACSQAGETVKISAKSTYKCRSDDVLTAAKKKWLTDSLLPEAERILEESLMVRPVPKGELKIARSSGPLPSCGAGLGAPVATKFADGSVEADLVIFVTARPIASDGVLAFASSCLFDSLTKRPIAGHLNYSPASLKVDSKLFGQIGTTLHEMAHVLGFSSSRFGEFFNPATNSTRDISEVKLAKGGKEFIQTQRVKSYVRRHFDCNGAEGAELEGGGGGGTSGSHWEKRVYQNEFMTGSSSSDPVFSNLTLEFFADSGWYTIAPTPPTGFETALIWGRGRGCDFLNEKCDSSKGWPDEETWPGYFCDDKLATGCSFDMRGKARCGITDYASGAIPADQRYLPNSRQGGLSQLADFCPFYSTAEYCIDPKNSGGDLEFYGESSRCFVNTLANLDSIGADKLGGAFGDQLSGELQQVSKSMGCYKTFCATDKDGKTQLKLLLGDIAYDCPAGEQIDVDGKAGKIECPPRVQVDAVCSDVPLDNDWPTVTSIEPAEGQPGQQVVIKGTNFKSGIKVVIDAECDPVTRVSDTELKVTLPTQENFKDPRHLAVPGFDKLIEKKSVVVTNFQKDGEERTAVLLNAFELSIPVDTDAFLGILDLAERHPMNTAILGIALLLGCLCCVYCCCSGGGGGRTQRSRRGDYGGYF